tara:strand:- start:1674 stop:2297 length:624 start_codon:yes stop_codon:yes gene_type:complete
MEKEEVEKKISELREKVTNQKSLIDRDVSYMVSNHRGVYYCFKLIRDSYWVSYIGVPEYVDVRTGDKDYNGLYIYNPIYLVDFVGQTDIRGIEMGHCPVYWLPSEVTLTGCGMNVEINSKTPLHWMGFDYAHLYDMSLIDANKILEDWDKDNSLTSYQMSMLNKYKFTTFEDVKNDCIKCIDSLLDTAIEREISHYTARLHNEFNLL